MGALLRNPYQREEQEEEVKAGVGQWRCGVRSREQACPSTAEEFDMYAE